MRGAVRLSSVRTRAGLVEAGAVVSAQRQPGLLRARCSEAPRLGRFRCAAAGSREVGSQNSGGLSPPLGEYSSPVVPGDFVEVVVGEAGVFEGVEDSGDAGDVADFGGDDRAVEV